jgi:protein-tyrosine-phosphatase
MPSVLFVCTANRFRSPLAAALFEMTLRTRAIPGAWMVSSAGTWVLNGQPALPSVCEAARAYGLDLSAHRSTRVSGLLLSRFDLVLVMEAGQKEALRSEFPSLYEQIYLLSGIVEQHPYDIPDTTGSFRDIMEVSTVLDELIRRGIKSICVLATYLHNARISSPMYDR